METPKTPPADGTDASPTPGNKDSGGTRGTGGRSPRRSHAPPNGPTPKGKQREGRGSTEGQTASSRGPLRSAVRMAMIGLAFLAALAIFNAFLHHVALLVAAAAVGTGIGVLRAKPVRVFVSPAGILSPDQQGAIREWTVFKIGLFIVYNLLFVLPVVLIANGIHASVQGSNTLASPGLNRSILTATVITILLTAFLSRASHRLPLDIPVTTRTRVASWILLIVLVVSAVLAAYTAQTGVPAGAFLLVTAWMLLGLLYMARPLPSPRSLFMGERRIYLGPTHLTQTRSMWTPLVAAATATLLGLLLVLVVGLGAGGMRAALDTALFRIVFPLLVLLAVLGTIVTFVLSTRPDKLPTYRTAQSREQRHLRALFTLSGVLVTLFLGFMVVTLAGWQIAGWRPGTHRWVEFLALAVMSAVGPYGFHHAYKQHRIRRLEERFPGFLRDLASARRAGLTLEQAIMMARRGDYGELGPEIERMADQLSWKMPFEQVLQEFSDRVKTPLVERAVSLIKEASWTGGNIASVLDAASKDAQEIQKIMSERQTTTRVYAGIVYIGFFIFLGVAVVLYVNLVPELVGSAQELTESGAGSDRIEGLTVNPDIALTDFRIFYFIAALAQAVGGGFVAGLMGTGKWPNGLPHIFLMSAMTVVTFLLFG